MLVEELRCGSCLEVTRWNVLCVLSGKWALVGEERGRGRYGCEVYRANKMGIVGDKVVVYVCTDLAAIHYLYSMPRGYRSRHRVTHDIMLSLLYLGLGSRVWLQYYYTELCSGGTVPKRLISPGSSWLVVLEEES